METHINSNEVEGTAQVLINNVAVFSMNKFNELWWTTSGLTGFEDAWDAARDAIATLRTLITWLLNN